jgi:hypothetical protein
VYALFGALRSVIAERKTHWSEFDTSGMTSAKRDAQVVTLRKQGYSIRQIATYVGMSPAGIRGVLERVRTDDREGTRGADLMSPPERDRAEIGPGEVPSRISDLAHRTKTAGLSNASRDWTLARARGGLFGTRTRASSRYETQHLSAGPALTAQQHGL